MTATTQNVISLGGGKVHTAYDPKLISGKAFPFCRTGAMTNAGTRYRFTEAEVTCRNCLLQLEYQGNAADREAEAAKTTETTPMIRI